MIQRFFGKPGASVRIGAVALAWIILISVLHASLNGEPQHPKKLLMGYMPVIANLAAPLVDYATRDADVRFDALKFGSFAEMAEAFRSNHIQAAFIIAPLALVLHQQGVPLKIVYIGNRHESTFVKRKGLNCRTPMDMAGKTVAVPIRFSGHLLAIKRCLREHGADPDSINIVEIPPPDMAAALASGGIEGYFVGEPFAGKAIESGIAERMLDVESIWPHFICNLMIVRAETVQSHPDWVQALVSAAVRSGFWARDHIDEAIEIAMRYWNQDPKVVRYAFTQPPDRIRFDLYMPLREELELIASEMDLAGLTSTRIDVEGIIDDRFARAVVLKKAAALKEALLD